MNLLPPNDIEVGRRGAENAFPPVARPRWRAEIVYLHQSWKEARAANAIELDMLLRLYPSSTGCVA
jgi:hypothetical protein